MSKKCTLAFVGVGRMGANMALHLNLDCGYRIATIYDADPAVAQKVAGEVGAVAVTSLSEVTASADVIFTVVSNDEAMRQIFLGESSLLQNANGKLFINCATLSPGIQCEVAQAAEQAGARVLEAAMASSISQARDGSLYLMIGGHEDDFAAHKGLLEDLSVNLRHCGPVGKAAEVKALVNMVMNCNTAALAEGLGLADALGLNLAMVREVFAQTGANSRVLETDAEDMVARDHECWFSAEHAAKDSGIAADLASSAGLHLPLNQATLSQYQKLVSEGKGGLDKSGVAELTFQGRSGN